MLYQVRRFKHTLRETGIGKKTPMLIMIGIIIAIIGYALFKSIMFPFLPNTQLSVPGEDPMHTNHSAENAGNDENRSKVVLKNRQENRISIIIPLVNLAISLVIGIYMFHTFLQAATGLSP